MSNDYWKELKRLVKRAEKASGGNSATEYRVAYVLMQQYVNSHSPAPESADARIAELERECSQWREELRIYRETENARIAELEQSVTVRDTEIARLETDLELARRDGERYRYVRRKGAWIHHDLRKLGSIGPVFVTVEYGRGEALDTERLDAAIDAAIDDGCQKVSEMLEARAGNGGGA